MKQILTSRKLDDRPLGRDMTSRSCTAMSFNTETRKSYSYATWLLWYIFYNFWTGEGEWFFDCFILFFVIWIPLNLFHIVKNTKKLYFIIIDIQLLHVTFSFLSPSYIQWPGFALIRVSFLCVIDVMWLGLVCCTRLIRTLITVDRASICFYWSSTYSSFGRSSSIGVWSIKV